MNIVFFAIASLAFSVAGWNQLHWVSTSGSPSPMETLTKAMVQSAADSMALFLAINTSSVTLLPTGVIALRAAAGSSDPAGILPTTLFATMCSKIVAIVVAKLYARAFIKDRPVEAVGARLDLAHDNDESGQEVTADAGAYPTWVSAMALIALAGCVPLAVIWGKWISPWVIPGLMLGFLTFGFVRRVRVATLLQRLSLQM